MKRKKLAFSLAALLVSLSTGVWASQAMGARQGATPSKHCVARLGARAPGSLANPITDFKCFSTFSGSIYYATGGRVVLPSNASASSVNDALLNSPDAVNDVIIGIDWDLANFTGNSLTWTNPLRCDAQPGISFVANSYPAGWNDVVSSATAYAACIWGHYEAANLNESGGYGIERCNNSGACANMHALTNRTSSSWWDGAYGIRLALG